MEEGAPLNPSSGGTPTAMVAVPMLNTALGQRFSMLGGTGVGTKMEASIHLRAKDFAAHRDQSCNISQCMNKTHTTKKHMQNSGWPACRVQRVLGGGSGGDFQPVLEACRAA